MKEYVFLTVTRRNSEQPWNSKEVNSYALLGWVVDQMVPIHWGSDSYSHMVVCMSRNLE